MSALRRHAWVAPPMVFAIAAGALVGALPAWLVYAVVNVGGVWLYCDRLGSQRAARQRRMKFLAMLMLPVGLYGLLASGGSAMTASEAASVGSGDEAVRRASARASSRTVGGGTGQPY